MISTITTSTISVMSDMPLFGTLGLIGAVVLFTLLVQKEVFNASRGERMERIKRTLNIAIFPLLAVFLMLVATKVAEMIR
jgi:hypothetical protein